MITLFHYLTLSVIIFSIGIFGVLWNRQNIIILLMSIELIMLAVNINFVAFSSIKNDLSGQIFVFFILTVAATETAIGLAIIVLLFRKLKTVSLEKLNHLKG